MGKLCAIDFLVLLFACFWQTGAFGEGWTGVQRMGEGTEMRLEEEKTRNVRKISKKRTGRTRTTRTMGRLKIDCYYFDSDGISVFKDHVTFG